MSFLQSIKSLFKNWDVFSGTCSRKEFWYGQLFLLLMFCLIGFFMGFITEFAQILDIPKGFIMLFTMVFVLSKIFFGVPYWTQFVRRYHDVGLSGQFFWFNILANGLMNDQLGPILNGLGFSLFILCYVLASLPSKKFKDYKPSVKRKKKITKGEYHVF